MILKRQKRRRRRSLSLSQLDFISNLLFVLIIYFHQFYFEWDQVRAKLKSLKQKSLACKFFKSALRYSKKFASQLRPLRISAQVLGHVIEQKNPFRYQQWKNLLKILIKKEWKNIFVWQWQQQEQFNSLQCVSCCY